MDLVVYKKVKSAIQTLDLGLPKVEAAKAVYDTAVYHLGVERVGQFEDYLIKPAGYWTLENCIADAKKYKTRSEWKKKSESAYGAARKNNWLFICCEGMPASHKVNNWTLEKCITDAKKYKTRWEWSKKSSSAYVTASKNSWLEICCKGMTNLLKSWSLENCIADAKNYKTRWEWKQNSQPAYQAACRNNWLEQCCLDMEPKRKPKSED